MEALRGKKLIASSAQTPLVWEWIFQIFDWFFIGTNLQMSKTMLKSSDGLVETDG
jgi:hypothetical protein